MIKCLYELLYIVPINVLIFEIYSNHYQMNNNLLGIIASIAIPALLVTCKHVPKRIRIICFGIITIVLGAFLFALGKDGREHMLTENKWIAPVVVISVISFLVGIILNRLDHAKRIIILLCCLTLIVIGFFPIITFNNFEFALIIYLVLLVIVDEIQHRWIKEGDFTQLSHLVMTSPIIILICVIVFIFPKSNKPYDFSYIKSIAYKTYVAFNNIKGNIFNNDEQYVSTGFSSENGFSGRIGDNETKVFRLAVSNSKADTVYLTGNICNRFMGRSWISDTDENYHDRMLDTLETTCQIAKYDRENKQDYINKANIEIENLLFNTHFYFVPSKLRYGFFNIDDLNGNTETNAMVSKKRMGYGKRYDYVVYELNTQNDRLINMLNEAKLASEDEWNSNVKNEGMWYVSGYTYNEYLEYRKRITEEYLLNVDMSDDVRCIVDGIYADSDNDYERLKKLESYLKSFSYSDSPGPLPDTVKDSSSYLDYFLLDSKEGYCMHYATAFVLLARSMGYPARYVSGYCVRKPSSSAYVMEKRAHAWAEVYFDNVGWITFDATPGYIINNGWASANTQNELHTIYKHTNNEESACVGEATSEHAGSGEIKNKTFFNRGLIAKILLAVAFFLILYLGGSIFVSRVIYNRLNPLEKLKFLFRRNQRILKRVGYSIKEGETLAEFKDRIDLGRIYCDDNMQKMNILPQSEILCYIEDYEIICYSNKEVTPDYLERAVNAYNLLRIYQIRVFLKTKFLLKYR